MLLQLQSRLPDVFSNVLVYLTYRDLDQLQNAHKNFRVLLTSSIYWHRRLFHQLRISHKKSSLCTYQSSKLLERLACDGLTFPLTNRPPKTAIANLNNISIYFDAASGSIASNDGSGLYENIVASRQRRNKILNFHSTNVLHIKSTLEEKIFPEGAAKIFVEIEMSLDLEAKIDNDEPWQVRLNEETLKIENPLQFFISTLQAHSYCNYRPFSVNESIERKWFTFIPALTCTSQIENCFEIRAFNQIGFSGIRVRSIKLLASSPNRKFVPGLYIKTHTTSTVLEKQISSKYKFYDTLYHKIDETSNQHVANFSRLALARHRSATSQLIGTYQAVEHIQKLSPGYYLEYPEQGELAQILKLQQAAYLNIRFQLKFTLDTPASTSTRVIAVLRMRLLERFHLGSQLSLRYHLGPENCPYFGDAVYKEVTLDTPNYYFASQFPVGEWFEWEICALDLRDYLIYGAEPSITSFVYSCHLKCKNDRSWKSGIEFSNIQLFLTNASGSGRSSIVV